MGKGQRNRGDREIDLVESPKKLKAAKAKAKTKRKTPMPKWLKNTIAIAIAVVLVLGIVALVMLSNGTFRRMQTLVKSRTGEYDINRQMASFIAWEIEYYTAYAEYKTAESSDKSSALLTQYKSPELYATNYATLRVTQEVVDKEDNVISSPRDAIDNTVAHMINFVAVCDYVRENRPDITLAPDEWKSDFDVTWGNSANGSFVTWSGLEKMQKEYGYLTFDRFLDDFFGHGLNAGDVEDALKLMCLYEKYMAVFTEELENGADDGKLVQYVKDHPSYFYSTDFLLYNTDSEELKQAMINAKTDEEFLSLAANDWFNTKGNYKDIYNEAVTLKLAEDNLAAIKDTTNENGGTAWTDALGGIGAVYHEYKLADRDNTEVIEADLSKWLFESTRAQYDDTLIVTDKGFYVISFSHAVYENNEKVAVAVYEKVYEHSAGDAYGEDTEFKNNVWKHLLSKLEVTEGEAPAVSYKTALERAQALEEAWAELDAAGKLEKLKQEKEYRYTKEATISDDSVPSVIIKSVFGGNDAPEVGKMFSVKESDIMAYIVYVESVTPGSDDDATGTVATIHYSKYEGDVFYTILDKLVSEIESAMPEEAFEYYTESPVEGTHFEFLFKGATYNTENMTFALNGAADKNAVKEYYSETTNSDGSKKVNFAIYFVTDPLHLNHDRLVNGGYFAYSGDNAQQILDEQLKGKTGADLIGALQKIGVVDTDAINSAIVSKNMDRETVELTSAALADWLFAERAEGAANEVGLVNDNGKTYFAVYLDEKETWMVLSKIYYVTDTLNSWMAEQRGAYTVNDWVLGLYGDPTPVTDTTTSAAQ